ncbi:MAG: hypothetical protein Q9P90_15295 [candidate division KSB1 bacterium]|nr:hypothetical protein [candidate division KSB1 bacterium]
MRIGEIAIVGANAEEERAFVKSIADTVEVQNDRLTFGQFHVNDQLLLHLYGISLAEDENAISWDLISSKLLGFVVLFRWGDVESFRKCQKLVDTLISRYDAVVVVAGHTEGRVPVLPSAFDFGIPIDKHGSFIFCNVFDPTSVRKVLIALVDLIIDQLS